MHSYLPGKAVLMLLLMLGLMQACKHEQEPPIDFGFNYLPMEKGGWIEYRVDSIVFDDFNQRTDSFSFVMRDECTGQFEDEEGRTAYRYERSYRSVDSADFVFRKAYYLVREGTRSERLEDNLRTVPLVYPPHEDQRWDINAFNTLGSRTAVYDYVDQPAQFGELMLDSSLRVLRLIDTNNFIVKRFEEERYARNVGLVYREFFHIETQFEIDSGLHWIQVITDHGQ